MKSNLLLILLVLFFASCNGPKKKTSHEEPRLKIAYNIHEHDTINKSNYEIIVMNMDGSDKKNITNHKDVAWTYYAFRDRLFFISDRDTCPRCYFLYETNAQGDRIRQVSTLRLEDSWMSSRKDGQEMVVSGRIGNEIRYQLFLIDTKSGAYTQLTHDTADRYGDPCFSPDGKKIAFYYKKERRNRNTHEELFVMNVDGSDMQQLTHYPEDNISASQYGYRAGAIKWHPTENFITYVSLQDGRHSIFAITTDGSRQWKLIENTDSDGWHDWSPDGKWLTYNKSDLAETQYHIMLMNWATKETKQLTDTTYAAQQSPVFVEF